MPAPPLQDKYHLYFLFDLMGGGDLMDVLVAEAKVVKMRVAESGWQVGGRAEAACGRFVSSPGARVAGVFARLLGAFAASQDGFEMLERCACVPGLPPPAAVLWLLLPLPRAHAMPRVCV